MLKINDSEFLTHFINPNLTRYLGMRDPKSWYNKLFVLPFCKKELTDQKIDLIKKLKETLEMLWRIENNFGKLFLLLFLFYQNTFETKSGNKFSGNNGDTGKAIEACLINIILFMEKNIDELKNNIEQFKSEENILPKEYKLDNWLEIKLNKNFNSEKQEAIQFVKTHQKSFRPENKHQTGCFFHQKPNPVLSQSSSALSDGALSLRVFS